MVTLATPGFDLAALAALTLLVGISTDPSTYFDRQDGTLGGTTKKSVGAIIAAFGSVVTAIIATAGYILTNPGEALAVGAADIVESITTHPAMAWAASWELPLMELTEGQWQWLAIFAPLVMTGLILGAAWMLNEYRKENGTDVPLTNINIPFVGADGEEGGDE